MKQVITLATILTFSLQGFTQQVDWVQHGKAPKNERGNAIARDNDGHIYVTGSFTDSVRFGNTVLVESYGNYYAKYDTTGTLIWAKEGLGGSGIVFDGGNALYLFNNEKTNLQKIDLNGTLIWDKELFNTSIFGSNGVMGVQADATHIYATGFFSGDAWFTSDTLINAGGWDIFIAAYDQDGNFAWAAGGGGAGLDKGYDVAVNATGEVYATGYFKDAAMFGGSSLTSNGLQDIYLAKYSASGVLQDIDNYGGAGFDLGGALVLDESGNIYMTGRYTTEMTFGTETLTAQGMDAFVARLGDDGVPVWAEGVSGVGGDEEGDIAYESGHVLFISTTAGSVSIGSTNLTGLGNLDMCIGSFTSGGILEWARLMGSSSDDEGAGVLSLLGSQYFTGSFKGNAQFDDESLTNVGMWDIVTGKIIPGGMLSLTDEAMTGPVVYPNPVRDVLTVRLSEEGNYHLRLTDATGKIQLMEKASGQTQLVLDHLQSGYYLLQVIASDGTVWTAPVIRQ